MSQPTNPHDYRCEIDEISRRLDAHVDGLIELRCDIQNMIAEPLEEHTHEHVPGCDDSDPTPPFGIERPVIAMSERGLRLAATTAAFTALFKLAEHITDVDEFHSVTHELSRDAWGSRSRKP